MPWPRICFSVNTFRTSAYDVIKSVKALDKKTVRIVLIEANNTFINDLTVEYMCVMSKAAIERGMDVANLPSVTSGAYTVEKWEKGKSIVLKANPYFVKGEPAIKKARVYFKLPEESVYQAFKNGTIDYVASVPMAEVARFKIDDEAEVLKYDYLRFPRAEEFGVFVNSKSPLARLKFITPADCVKEPLVISSRLLVQKEIKSWLGTFAEEVKISATVNLPFHSIQLVRQGSGIAFTLKRNEVFEGVKFLTLEPKLPIRTILVWKKNQILSPVATAFLEFVKGSME